MLGIRPRSTSRQAAVVFAATFLLHVVVVSVVRDRGWDDGAITMAFADTFAHTGRISITPSSEVVEGFSSPFWLLVLAGVYRTLPLGFDGMILAAQLLAALCAALGATLLWSLLRPFLPRTAILLSIAVFAYAPFLLETANGMEMTALSAVTLAILRLVARPQPRTWPILSLAALAPWIRLEAGGYVLAAAVAMIVLSRDRRRAGALIVGAVTSLLALTVARLVIFDSVVPNTILAKRWPVYGSETPVQHFVIPALDFAYALAPGVLLAVAAVGLRVPAFRLARIRNRALHRVVAYIAGYLVAVGIFNIAIGYNWGYHGRMEQSVIALAVVLAVYLAPAAARPLDSLRRLAPVLLAMSVLTVFGVFVGEEKMTRSWPVGRADDTTPASIAQTARALDEIRDRLGLATMSVLLPDIGGSALCCRQLQILDLGMLASSQLAREGYDAAGRYVEATRPDAIVDPAWGAGSTIYDTEYFRDHYVPVAFGDEWIYLQQKHFAHLRSQCSWISVDEAKPLWYNPDGYTEAYLRRLGDIDICRL